MANAPKKGAVARAVSVATPVEAVAATINAVLPTESQLVAAPTAEIQQSFRGALEKGVIEVTRRFRQGQDRRG